MRRAVLLLLLFVGKTPGEGPPKGEGTSGVSTYPQRPHRGRSSAYPSVVSRPLAPSHVRLTGLPLRLFIQGESEGDELALRSLGIFDDPVPFASSFQRVASGKSIGELITNPLGG